METMSVESSLKRIMDYASRPLSEALKMLESLQHTVQDTKEEIQNFYRLAYQMACGDQFRSLVLCLLGHKDHEKSFDCVRKEEKDYRPRSRDEATAISPYYGGKLGTQFLLT